MAKNPLVSIISPCYNGEKYLVAFLDSVLAQDYAPIELVFVNDGSTDSTEQIAMSYKAKFSEKGIDLRYIYQENAGQAAAINCGLKVFTGDYMMWMDSDDILYPNHVSEKVKFLEEHKAYGFVLAQGERVPSKNLNACMGIVKREKPQGKDTLFEDLIFEKNVVFGPGTIMVRREAFEEAIPNKHIYESRQGQNWQMILPLAYLHKCGYIEKVLFKYVNHSDSHSNQRRNYAQWIERYDGFEALQLATIEHIPQMSEDEKENWRKTIRQRCTRKRLDYCYRFLKVRQVQQNRRMLKEMGYTLTKDDSFFSYWYKTVTKVIKRKLARR